jgi:putative ABC transport system substrate-binding protein
MKRRQFVFSAATFALINGCGVLPILGSPAARGIPRVGILAADANNDTETLEIAGLKQGLAEQGYVDGQTIAFELRTTDGNLEALPELANALVQLPVDVLFAVPSPSVAAAQQATRDIPIVFANASDPVGKGWVASLDHPSGNLTGVTAAPPTRDAKLVEFLAQLVPRLSRVAFVTSFDPADPSLGPLAVQQTTTAVNALGIQVKFLDVRSPGDVEPVLAEELAWQTEAMVVLAAVAVAPHVSRFVDFQLQNRLPLAVVSKEQVQAGALLSYSVSSTGAGQTAARFVDRILKGTRPADLPVEMPTAYELVVNQSTAQALGMTVPPQVAQQVTEWIQ